MVAREEADALVCGAVGQFQWHLRYVEAVLGAKHTVDSDRHAVGALSAMVLDSGPVFIADTHVNPDPSAEQLVRIALCAATEVRRFGLVPRVAFISHANFGDIDSPSATKMRRAVALMDDARQGGAVDFEYEGEMHTDAALDPELCARLFPNSRLRGPANLLIMPNTDAASATKGALKVLANGLQVGPILLGLNAAAHIVTPSITARGILNVAALAGARAGSRGA